MRLINVLILLILGCTYSNKNNNESIGESDSVSSSGNEQKELTSAKAVDPVEMDSLTRFLSLFDCGRNRFNVDYEFNYCQEIPFDYAVEFLNHESGNRSVKFYTDKVEEFKEGYGIYYYTTCGVGGFCFGKVLAFLDIDGQFLKEFVLEELFGDMERSTKITSTSLGDFTFLRETLKTEVSMETLDTLSLKSTSDTLRLIPRFKK